MSATHFEVQPGTRAIVAGVRIVAAPCSFSRIGVLLVFVSKGSEDTTQTGWVEGRMPDPPADTPTDTPIRLKLDKQPLHVTLAAGPFFLGCFALPGKGQLADRRRVSGRIG
jgi:hypothetical protein